LTKRGVYIIFRFRIFRFRDLITREFGRKAGGDRKRKQADRYSLSGTKKSAQPAGEIGGGKEGPDIRIGTERRQKSSFQKPCKLLANFEGAAIGGK